MREKPVDVVITDLGAIPPRYFMEPEVIHVLRKVIAHDVFINQSPVPAGCKPVLGTSGSELARSAALSRLFFGIKKEFRSKWYVLLAAIIGGLTAAAITWALLRYF